MGIDLNTEQVLTIYKCENWFKHSSQQVFEIAGAAGTGKAQPVDTMIPTPVGFRKLGDLQIGDHVFNKHGKPVRIKGIYDQGKLKTYKITLSDGRSTLCNDEHIWYVVYKGISQNLTLREIINIYNSEPSFQNFYVPRCQCVEYSHKSYSTDPYHAIRQHLTIETLRQYAYGSKFQRWKLIQGYFDECGHIDSETGELYITHYDKAELRFIQNILASLGCIARLTQVTSRELYNYKLYRLDVLVRNNLKKEFFLYNEENYAIAKSVSSLPDAYDTIYVTIEKIEELGYECEMRCIYVDDPDHLYLTNDYIVTHNTTIVLYLIERLGLKMDEVLFLAYQGKAACRLTMTGLPAQTIHSAIYRYEKEYMKDADGRYLRNEKGNIRKKGVFKKRDYIGEKNNIKLIVIDEAGMVNKEIAEDLKSFGIPIIVLGDLNQLPPVFGNPYFLMNPDVVLTRIMRQNEGNPIVYLSQEILAGHNLNIGIYGKSEVIPKSDITDSHFSKSDIVLTETNRLRWNVNNFFREQLRKYKQLDYPHNGEKVICRKNNWKRSIDGGIFLTNGMSGYVDSIQKYTFNRKENTMIMDFRPDFTQSIFKDVKFNYEFMYSAPQSSLEDTGSDMESFTDYFHDRFEFGYAITVHLSQGSQYNRVLYLNENIMRTKEDQKKLAYTAITRAIDSISIVV